MAQPRVLFMSGSSSGRVNHWFAWRLVSGNNRELARGSAYGDFESCLGAVKQLREEPDQLSTRVALDGESGQWGWTASSSERIVARSSRVYQRERECRYSLDHFLTALPIAVVSDQVLDLDSGRGRRPSSLHRTTRTDRGPRL